METPVRVRVRMLGIRNQYFTANRSIFEEQSERVGGSFVEDPPPFAAACTDGMLLLFNVRYDVTVRVNAACLTIPLEDLRQDPALHALWQEAGKPVTLEQAKKHFRFPTADATTN